MLENIFELKWKNSPNTKNGTSDVPYVFKKYRRCDLNCLKNIFFVKLLTIRLVTYFGNEYSDVKQTCKNNVSVCGQLMS